MALNVSTLGFRAIAAGIRLPSSRRIEVFHQQGHLIDLLRRLRINLFLDVGANRGFYAHHLRQSGYAGRLCSFEPIPADCATIAARAAGDPLWTTHNLALGAEDGTAAFTINRTEGETVLSSFLPMSGTAGIDQTTIEVPVARLDTLLPELVVGIAEPRIFLKMDTQGFDLEVMKGASGILYRILGLQSEVAVVPLYDGMPAFAQSIGAYQDLGYGLLDLFVVNRIEDGRVLEYDCVMARPEHLSAG